jgi:hypothetical protein
MRTVYRIGDAGCVRLSPRTVSELSPPDERGNWEQIGLCHRERVGLSFSRRQVPPSAPACGSRNKARNGPVNLQVDTRS